MLHRNMKPLPPHLRLGLEDLLGDLWHARRRSDLGRLALLSYYEVRRWARMSGKPGLVEHSSELISGRPLADRNAFLSRVDILIAELEKVLATDRRTAEQDGEWVQRQPAEAMREAESVGRSAR